MEVCVEKIVIVADYRSNGAERLGSRFAGDSARMTFTGPLPKLAVDPSLFRSAICRFTRSISTISFLDSKSLSACLHIFWKSWGA